MCDNLRLGGIARYLKMKIFELSQSPIYLYIYLYIYPLIQTDKYMHTVCTGIELSAQCNATGVSGTAGAIPHPYLVHSVDILVLFV
jgi:hypothetical protein